jgi:hypothetical protein
MKATHDREIRWREAYPHKRIPIITLFKSLAVWGLVLWFCYSVWELVLSFLIVK